MNITLTDGLDLNTLKLKFSWILKAVTKNAVIGISNNGELIWYSGSWIYGKWEKN